MDSIRKISQESQGGDWIRLTPESRKAVQKAVEWCVKHQHALPSKNYVGVPEKAMLDIIDESIQEEFGKSLAELQRPNRNRTIVDIRNMVIVIYREKTRASLKEIGDIFGRTHCTIIHSLENARFLIDYDKRFHDTFYSLKNKIEQKCEDYLTSCGQSGSSPELF